MEKKYLLTASLICADLMHIADQVKQLEEANIDYIHIDVMDGHFVPRFGVFPEIAKQIRALTNIPMDVHMMTNNPEPYIKDFVDAGVQIIAVHVEDNPNLHRTIKMIKDSGIMAGVVLNMATPLNVLDYILDDIGFIMLMAINPGVVGHKIIPTVFNKIKDLKEKTKNYPDMLIEIDGGVTPESLPEMIKAGANMFVCGTGSIFRPAAQVKEKTIELRKTVDAALLHKNIMYKVLITTSGTGSRLGDMTKETNKSLLPLGNKLIISHLIDSYPIDVPMVITVGYFGQKVIEETKKLYPNRDITFVTIDKYEGPGSSLAYSMLQAKDQLQCPFVFHACDTITKFKIPAVDYNRVIGYDFPDSTQYTTFNVEGEYIKNYNKGKGAKEFDYVHIGLVGIYDYKDFWKELGDLYDADRNNGSLNDVVALSAMIDKGIKFKYFAINDWLDTGNLEAFAHAQKNI